MHRRKLKEGNSKICKGELTSCTSIQSRDSFVKNIASNISPSPGGIKAASFPLKNGFIYVLEISQSLTPPHQVNKEGKYYLRLDTETRPAPHGIVEALFYKRQRSDLVGEVGILRISDNRVKVIFSLANKSSIHAEGVNLIIELKGIKQITRLKNVHIDPIQNDDCVRVHESFSSILVRGITSGLK